MRAPRALSSGSSRDPLRRDRRRSPPAAARSGRPSARWWRRRTGRCCTRGRPQPLAALSSSVERQVELRRPSAHSSRRRGCRPRELHGGPAARSAATNMTWNSGLRLRSRSRLQLLHQLLERQVLVGVGARAPSRATRPSSSRKRRIAGQIGAQHQRVDEEADQRLESRPRLRPAIGDADDDVVLAACSARAAPGTPPAAS